MSGLANATLAPLGGFEHVLQSIAVILTTRPGTRVMRRDFGSRLVDLIDRPMNRETVMEVFVAIAEAIERWEPRFGLTRLTITEASAAGGLAVALEGIWFPRGHLGDVSVGVARDGIVPLAPWWSTP